MRTDRTGVGIASTEGHGAIVLIAVHIASSETEGHAVSVGVVDLHIGGRIDGTTRRNGVDLRRHSSAECPWSVRCTCNKPRCSIAEVIHLLAIDERRTSVCGVLHAGPGNRLEACRTADRGELGFRKCAVERCNVRDCLLVDGFSCLRRIRHGCKNVAPRPMRINVCKRRWNRRGLCIGPRAVHEVSGGEPASG